MSQSEPQQVHASILIVEDDPKQVWLYSKAMRGYKLPDWIRVSVGKPADNERFVTELKAWLVEEKVSA